MVFRRLNLLPRFMTLAAHRMQSIERRAPAVVGDSLRQIETPCLLVDLRALEKNVRFLPESLQRIGAQVHIRPHAKAHKCAAIGRLQIQESQAVGLCCQKVCEAEAMFKGGIKDLLLSNEIIGIAQYERVAALAAQGAKMTLVFDNMLAIQQAQQVAMKLQVDLHALVEVNVGQDRCGVDTFEQVLDLALCIKDASNLTFDGLQCYHGGAQHIRKYTEKRQVIAKVCEKARTARDFLAEKGLECKTITGGGTGTYLLEASSGVFTEIQPGSYIFNDADYARNWNADGESVSAWKQSLFVLTTVMSTNTKKQSERAIIDAGMKAVSLDSGPPVVYKAIDDNPIPQLEYRTGGDEHGILCRSESQNQSEMPAIGQKLMLIPGHCDPTVNMYDFLVGFRDDKVEKVWTIDARGPGN